MPYIDLADLPEDERIKVIGNTLMRNPGINIGVPVDKGGEYEGKGDRYRDKLLKGFPGVVMTKRMDGPINDTETLFFTYRETN